MEVFRKTGITATALLSVLFITFITLSQAKQSLAPIGVTSLAFRQYRPIPKKHTCRGENLSPEIRWTFSGKAESFAIVCSDPDAPKGTFIHWIIYNIPARARRLPEGIPQKPQVGNGDIQQGKNDFGKVGYQGPCPPAGKSHRYIFTVYALDRKITGKQFNLAALKQMMNGHIVGEGRITGIFKL